MVKSPCIGQCVRENGACIGCGRTIEQIKNWTKMTDEERDDIIHELKKKKWANEIFNSRSR
jgi:predicted Fe-S protein YdhL (DUF1289 family)